MPNSLKQRRMIQLLSGENKSLWQEKYKHWTENEYFDLQTRTELLKLEDEQEIEDRFYTDLEFGTGGMRGIMGAGTNRMNKYVIRRLSQGLADTIKTGGAQACRRGVVIAFDSRRYSAEFALETALVLAANSINVFLFEALRPTPELSFAVRYLKAIAGVNITASHNPKEYNGYKVYWEDGGQIPPGKAQQIIAEIAGQKSWEIQLIDEQQAYERNLLRYIGSEVDQAYFQEIKKLLLYPGFCRESGKKLRIVYTPLHGAGSIPVQRVLKEAGFTSLFTVPEQEKPDPEFATVQSPNPEDPLSFTLALDYASRQQADIVLATDPDADRLGLYARDRQGNYRRFTGNQIGVLLAYYLLSQKAKLQTLPRNACIIKTVVSTELGEEVAKLFGVKTINVLVGFKYIGEQIKKMEEQGTGSFIFGFEESNGYLAGTFTRDKDGIQAALLICEAALYYAEKEHKTLPEVLGEIFQQCGYYLDEQTAVSLQGREGKENIKKIMECLRNDRIREFAGLAVNYMDDYLSGKRFLFRGNREEKITGIDLPRENGVKFVFDGGGFIMARPSGTEPKIRFYFCLKSDTPEALPALMSRVKTAFFTRIQAFIPSEPEFNPLNSFIASFKQ